MNGFKLVTYQAAQGPRAGIILGETVFDAAAMTGNPAHTNALEILRGWFRFCEIVTARKQSDTKGWPLSETHLRTPILTPGAIYCAGANYRDHAIEMAKRMNRPLDPDPKISGGRPWHFLKPGHCVADPGATIAASTYSKKLDWEVELAAIIGKPARNVSAKNALDYVAGYTAANDLSARDLSRRTEAAETSAFHFDWIGQKCFDGSCPIGPWIVPAGDIPDVQNLSLKLWVNDALKQDSNTREMIFTLAEQIAHLSIGMTLHPGDIILTGTPAGVGAGRGESLSAGDIVRIEIESIGTLTNRIA